MIKKLRELIKGFLNANIENEEERVHIQFKTILLFFLVVSYFMSIFNYFTNWVRLGVICFVFGLCCTINLLVESYVKKLRLAGRVCFAIEFIMMFISFLVVGEPEGFSALWILVVPCCGFFLFRMKYGLIISSVQLLIIIFLVWTPIGRSFLMYDYTSTFLMRFPIVYIAFMCVGSLFEVVRLSNARLLAESKANFEHLYNHDTLTGLFNRYGYNSTLDEFFKNRNHEGFAFAILDLDYFKLVNDRYGHLNGDVVLKETAKRLADRVGDKGVVSRWGGEEFSILFYSDIDAKDICKKMLDDARTKPIVLDNTSVIVPFSLGLVIASDGVDAKVAQVVKIADANLYYAKNNGRNQINCTYYTEETEFLD